MFSVENARLLVPSKMSLLIMQLDRAGVRQSGNNEWIALSILCAEMNH